MTINNNIKIATKDNAFFQPTIFLYRITDKTLQTKEFKYHKIPNPSPSQPSC